MFKQKWTKELSHRGIRIEVAAFIAAFPLIYGYPGFKIINIVHVYSWKILEFLTVTISNAFMGCSQTHTHAHVNMILKALFEFERSMAMMHWHPMGNVKMVSMWMWTCKRWGAEHYAEMHNTAIVSPSSSSPHQRCHHHHNQQITTRAPPSSKEILSIQAGDETLVEKQANFLQKYWISLTLSHAHTCSANALLAANNSEQTILECCQCILLLVCLLIYGCTNSFRRQAIYL